MAILFHTPWQNAADWLRELRAAVSDVPVRVWPEIGDPAEIEVAMVWRPPAGALSGLPALRAILSLGAGVDFLLADPNLPSEPPIARLVDPLLATRMAEYVAGAVLSHHLNLPGYRAQQDRRVWARLPQRDAGEACVGVLGLGHLGRTVAARLRGLGFAVQGWTRAPRAVPGIAMHDGPEGLDTLLAAADYLICLLPLTAETKGVLNARRLARLPAGAVVVNCARGEHVVEADLLAALDAGQLGGAVLDVFAEEPLPPAHRYWDHPKVTLTPHISSLSDPSSGARLLARQYRQAIAGEPIDHTVTRDRGY